MVGHYAPLYHLPGNVIYAAVGLVYINLQLPSSTRFKQFQKFEKFKLGLCPTSHYIRKYFCTGPAFLFIANCVLDLTFLAPLTSEK